MGMSRQKDEVHRKLWKAMERWFELREQGRTKHDLKMEGLRERGDMFYATRGLIFTGNTRLTYERILKRFVEWCHKERGITENNQIKHKEFRAYMEHRLALGGAASEMNKVRAAFVKFGALYGKYNSFHAMSVKVGRRIREMKKAGELRAPSRPKVTAESREKIIERLAQLDGRWEARTGEPRGYALVTRLQKEASLRAVEATERFSRGCLDGLRGDQGVIRVVGKGGRVRELAISLGLYRDLEEFFRRSGAERLARRRGYLAALRRAARARGGRVGGSHAHRRTSAQEKKNERYQEHLQDKNSPKDARKKAVGDTVEHLGHSRNRKDLARAYLGR